RIPKAGRSQGGKGVRCAGRRRSNAIKIRKQTAANPFRMARKTQIEIDVFSACFPYHHLGAIKGIDALAIERTTMGELADHHEVSIRPDTEVWIIRKLVAARRATGNEVV